MWLFVDFCVFDWTCLILHLNLKLFWTWFIYCAYLNYSWFIYCAYLNKSWFILVPTWTSHKQMPTWTSHRIVPTPTSHDSNSWIAYFKMRLIYLKGDLQRKRLRSRAIFLEKLVTERKTPTKRPFVCIVCNICI